MKNNEKNKITKKNIIHAKIIIIISILVILSIIIGALLINSRNNGNADNYSSVNSNNDLNQNNTDQSNTDQSNLETSDNQSNDKNQTDNNQDNNNKDQSNNSTSKPEYDIGQTSDRNNIKITFNKVEVVKSNNKNIIPDEGNDFVILNFTIQNNTDSSIYIDYVKSFNIYVDNVKVSTTASPAAVSDNNSLKGNVDPKADITGVVGLNIPSDYKTIKVYFLDGIDSNPIIFNYNK